MVHATHHLTLEANVAYETYGHCFMLEEGSERGNIFRRNLGLGTRAGEWMVALCTAVPLST